MSLGYFGLGVWTWLVLNRWLLVAGRVLFTWSDWLCWFLPGEEGFWRVGGMSLTCCHSSRRKGRWFVAISAFCFSHSARHFLIHFAYSRARAWDETGGHIFTPQVRSRFALEWPAESTGLELRLGRVMGTVLLVVRASGRRDTARWIWDRIVVVAHRVLMEFSLHRSRKLWCADWLTSRT
jgi:hypothetical protein